MPTKLKQKHMDTLSIIVSSICAIIGALGGGSLLYFKQDKKAKQLSNESTQSEEWRKLYERSDQDSRAKDEKIEKLYDTIQEHRDVKAKLREEITELKVKNAELTYTHCEVRQCPKRQPPTGY